MNRSKNWYITLYIHKYVNICNRKKCQKWYESQINRYDSRPVKLYIVREKHSKTLTSQSTLVNNFLKTAIQMHKKLYIRVYINTYTYTLGYIHMRMKITCSAYFCCLFQVFARNALFCVAFFLLFNVHFRMTTWLYKHADALTNIFNMYKVHIIANVHKTIRHIALRKVSSVFVMRVY